MREHAMRWHRTGVGLQVLVPRRSDLMLFGSGTSSAQIVTSLEIATWHVSQPTATVDKLQKTVVPKGQVSINMTVEFPNSVKCC